MLDAPNRLPLAFRWIDRTIVVTGNAATDRSIALGATIDAIDGILTATILQRLLPYVKADGANDGKRVYDLSVTGRAKYEAFDVFFPIAFKLGPKVLVEGRNPNGERFRAELALCTSSQRNTRLGYKVDPWHFSRIDSKTALWRLSTMAAWNFGFDWKATLADQTRDLIASKSDALVLDLRGNEGGLDEVIWELARALASKPITVPPFDRVIQYKVVPDDLRPYLETWDQSWFNVERRVTERPDGRYAPILPATSRISESRSAFKGRVILLVDEGNSSATFILALALKSSGIATIVGRPTGGSRRGINGGQMFMLRLPKSGIEIDIPLIGSFALDQPDQGVVPDHRVAWTAEDISAGRDPDLELVKTLLTNNVH